MQTIQIGPSRLASSAQGLGCMGMSEFYGPHNDDESIRTLERAFELGVTHFDTSNVYGRGHNERLVGRFVNNKRDQLVVSSKFGIARDPDGPEGSTYDRDIDNSPEYMRRCCEESLRRLGTDRIDIYYIHRADPKIPIEDTIGAMAKLVEAGKIRGIGLSEVSAEVLRRAHATHPISALQSEYSLWTREPEADVLPTCAELGVTFIAYSPLGRGFLTGAIANADELAKDDFRLTSPRFQGENFDRNKLLVEQVRALAVAKGCTPGQIAIAWIMDREQAIVPIPGTRRIKNLEENIGACDVSLNAADIEQLDAILPVGGAAGTRYEADFKGNPEALS